MTRFRIIDIIILGFMNFALFVGAGNIIFPPFIGLQAGTSVWSAAAGFLLTGVGLPVMTSIAMARAGGSMEAITQPLGKRCGILLTIICYLCIGPLFATPRTATVSYELAIQPLGGSERWLPLWSVVYFGVVALISLHPGRLLDTVGKILSPLKVVALIVLAVTVLLFPAGTPQPPLASYASAAFSQGVTNGYLTMDTLAALAFGLVIVNAIKSRGVTSARFITRYAVLSGLIAGLGLMLVYLSLFRLGTGSRELVSGATNGAEVLSAYVDFSYGAAGSIFLGGLITVACLVTAIGLTCACAGYFSSITRVSYRVYVWCFAAFSLLVSNLGLTELIHVSVPALTAVYPVFVVLILTYFIRGAFHSPRNVIAPMALVSLIFGIADALSSAGIMFWPLSAVHFLPLHHQGLAWLLPVLGVMVIAVLFDRRKGVLQQTSWQRSAR
ncbi:branched-chain amino acid transport system II carrier protein [Dickeya fangzhongdai]|uniref:branched-chain amino acid transport system II carrier protein n=1 Tax=Dickeya fangzhongdai TaxID=1778540 RepID=UPI000575053F|nr:branched-chain amino acid transport system II carrier protein [Dickeya fangzhongdai]AYH48592.1 branched-chain amino acid transport system II carrier protein [Dickeya fangzhongdai]KHN53659.1 branched-chain amino acid ABC transporter substrate-binding protein [Dickeya fangzhongdai]WPD75675.1 branched-chain amino acid transport system II carrier protein [Dickeya fangzhongdai]